MADHFSSDHIENTRAPQTCPLLILLSLWIIPFECMLFYLCTVCLYQFEIPSSDFAFFIRPVYPMPTEHLFIYIFEAPQIQNI